MNRAQETTLVFADLLDDPSANISDVFYVDSSVPGEIDGEFILSTKVDVFDVECPLQIVQRDWCENEYKKEGCWLWSGSAWIAPSGFTNEATECDHTRTGIAGCKFHTNSLRFGAAPALPSRELYAI